MAGLMWDRMGSYAWPFAIFSAGWVIAGLLMLFARPPLPPGSPNPIEPKAASALPGSGSRGAHD